MTDLNNGAGINEGAGLNDGSDSDQWSVSYEARLYPPNMGDFDTYDVARSKGRQGERPSGRWELSFQRVDEYGQAPDFREIGSARTAREGLDELRHRLTKDHPGNTWTTDL